MNIINLVKIGGSLIKYPRKLRELCRLLGDLSRVYKLIVVPGGGEIVDIIRKYYLELELSDDSTHWMAILAMDQYGIMLSDMIPNSKPTALIKRSLLYCKRKTLPIILPFRYIYKVDPLKHSWDITSDSIAAYIAKILGADRLILVKDVDGIYYENEVLNEVSIEWLKNHDSCVDKYFPYIIEKMSIECYIVNGLYPVRIKQIIEGKNTIFTKIIV